MDYTSMVRVFQKGSKKLISKKLYHHLIVLDTWVSELVYKKDHQKFCEWFTSSIRLAKKGNRPSWGHAAKVFDISMKVFIYFCGLPSRTQTANILPWLNGAIDSPILKRLRKDFTGEYSTLKSVTLKTMDKNQYDLVQHLMRNKAKKKRLLLVEWEEMMWRSLNRPSHSNR